MTLPRITLITPSLNQGSYIGQTISSVIDQQYPNLQYLVMDGGSTDNSVDIIRSYGNHITYWISEKDNGQAHAINKGLKLADGEIISWLNSDDYLEKDALFTLANHFSDSNVNCVIGKISYFNENGLLWKSKNVVKKPVEKTLGSGVVPQPAMYFRKSCYDQIGLLNEHLRYTFDAEWYMRYLAHYGIDGIREIPDVVVHFRFHKDSKTMNNRFSEERNSICYAIAKQTGLTGMMKLLEKLGPVDQDFRFVFPEIKPGISIEKAMNYQILLLGTEFYSINERQKAAWCFININEKLLEKEDLVFLKKLKIRNSYLPLALIKMLRKIGGR